MAYAYPGDGALDYFPCRYGKSKVLFRGPRRDLTREFCAVLGGTETYGKFVAAPFASLIEEATGIPMVNLGCPNAGVDLFSNDPTLIGIADRAAVTVVQIVGAQNMSNRFYSVHPRRNDRFLHASQMLKTLFREIDFTEFNFTRHMVRTLQARAPEKFECVADELRVAWVARMKQLLERIGGRTVLLWMADHRPPPAGGMIRLDVDPILIDAAMIAAVRSHATDYVEVVPSREARAQGVAGKTFAPMEEPAAALVPGPAEHREVARALVPVIRKLL
jgi:hypothetical protein